MGRAASVSVIQPKLVTKAPEVKAATAEASAMAVLSAAHRVFGAM